MLTTSNVLKERTFPWIIFLLKCMCFTCYFRFIGVYFLLNNEPEGNGNLNRLKNWSQCHQKLPVLRWCSVATLFAYSAGQMCLLQHFGWCPSHTLNRAGISSCELCLWGNLREEAVPQPCTVQGCGYVSPQSSRDTPSDWRHTAVLSPCYPDQSWTLQCQPGPGEHGVSCGEPL